MIEPSEFNPGKLGFGLMRLPRKGLSIDIDQTTHMVDLFMAAGLTYFDTAFIYPGSEAAIKKALIDRYPRESFTLATKLLVTGVPTASLAKKEFSTSLSRTGAGYFDYYLLHSINKDNCKKYEKFGIWDFVREQKENGKIRHYGFSFHDGPELLDEVLTNHPDTEFVQLQINYQDWEDPKVRSRAIYEVARKHNKPIVIMEPVKGGGLADPPQKVRNILKEANPDVSYASWAIRFAASLDGILAVLSGMSNIAQMEDNLSYMKDFKPLSRDEMRTILKARRALGSITAIPCTSCHYCTEGCPQQIPIPEIFSSRNLQLVHGRVDDGNRAYEALCEKGPSAADCIACGQCELVCPQKIDIITKLQEISELHA